MQIELLKFLIFRLLLNIPESKCDNRLTKPIGYIGTEYFGLHVLTVKSDDVCGLGAVLLELLPGKRAI